MFEQVLPGNTQKYLAILAEKNVLPKASHLYFFANNNLSSATTNNHQFKKRENTERDILICH